MISPPLSGLKVLELGELVAGPFIGTLLGEFGAEVIKIERPGRGDVLRQFGPMVEGESLYWAVNGRNKQSVVLDLTKPAGRAVLGELMARCDVLINSLRPGTLESWGFTEEVLKASFPALVIVYASAFGRIGPKASQGGYDPVAQGFSGLSDLTGEAEGPPMRAGGSIPVCDFMTGLAGALGAVLALHARNRAPDGGGQTVDIALYDFAFRMTGPLLSYYDLAREVWSRNGNHSLGGAPTGHFLTGDDHWICVSVQNDEQFRRVAGLMGRSDWLTDHRFADLESRTKHRELLCTEFADWARSLTRQDLIERFGEHGLIAGPINSVADMATDPHLAARGYAWVQDDELGEYRAPDVVPRLSGTPGSVRRRAPALGADTLEVLKRELSYSDAECARLEREGVLGEPGRRERKSAQVRVPSITSHPEDR